MNLMKTKTKAAIGAAMSYIIVALWAVALTVLMLKYFDVLHPPKVEKAPLVKKVVRVQV